MFVIYLIDTKTDQTILHNTVTNLLKSGVMRVLGKPQRITK